VLAAALYFGDRVLERSLAGLAHFRDEIALTVLLVAGAALYALAVFLLLGRGWFSSLLKDVGEAAEVPASKELEKPDPMQDSAALPDNTPPPNV
jgi:hypothetical protein